jgi:hypothetical protein
VQHWSCPFASCPVQLVQLFELHLHVACTCKLLTSARCAVPYCRLWLAADVAV